MKKLWIMMAAVTLCVSCFVGCGSGKETATQGEADGVQTQGSMNQTEEMQKNDIMSESTGSGEITEKNAAEATPEPMEEPVLYPGIDMESDLPGTEWIDTFVGVIDEPKIVVYSDITGRKEIVEEKATVLINPDEDIIAIYLPPGYMFGGSSIGIKHTDIIDWGYSCSFLLDSERTRETKYETAAICYKHETPEEYYLKFTIQSE